MLKIPRLKAYDNNFHSRNERNVLSLNMIHVQPRLTFRYLKIRKKRNRCSRLCFAYLKLQRTGLNKQAETLRKLEAHHYVFEADRELEEKIENRKAAAQRNSPRLAKTRTAQELEGIVAQRR